MRRVWRGGGGRWLVMGLMGVRVCRVGLVGCCTAMVVGAVMAGLVRLVVLGGRRG